MIDALNLIWIIPLCFCAGVLFTSFIVGATMNNKYEEVYNMGVKYGLDFAECKHELKGDLHEV